MAGSPLSAAEKQRILDLHAQGVSRNDIARQTGRSAGTVTKVVTDAGGSFDRAETIAATTAKQADAAAKRVALELDLLDDAHKLRAQIWQPHEYIDHGGKDFVEARWTQQEPTPADKLKLMQAAGAAIDRSLKLADHGKGNLDLSAVDKWLEHMFGQPA